MTGDFWVPMSEFDMCDGTEAHKRGTSYGR